MIRDEKDVITVDMKLKGHSIGEIAEATCRSPKTVANLLAKGGRLHSELIDLRQKRAEVLNRSSITALESLMSAREPAIEELKKIALESPNDAARLKAVDMIIGMTGVKGDIPPKLDSADPRTIKPFLEWAQKKIAEAFPNHPTVISVEGTAKAEGLPNYQVTPSELANVLSRLEATTSKMNLRGYPTGQVTDGQIVSQ